MSLEKNIYQRIIDVYKQVKGITKDGEITVGSNSYSIVSHDAVIRALHMPLAENGIVVVPTQLACKISSFEKTKTYNGKSEVSIAYQAEVTASITFVNADKPGEGLTSVATAHAFDTSDKSVGKAYSMAIKMIYMKMFLLESMDEEEARVDDGAKYRPKLPTAPPPPNMDPPNMGVKAVPRPLPNMARPPTVTPPPQDAPFPDSYEGPQEFEEPLFDVFPPEPPPPKKVWFLTEPQIRRFWAMSKNLKWSNQQAINFVNEYGLCGTPEDMTKEAYKTVTDLMQRQIDGMKK